MLIAILTMNKLELCQNCNVLIFNATVANQDLGERRIAPIWCGQRSVLVRSPFWCG